MSEETKQPDTPDRDEPVASQTSSENQQTISQAAPSDAEKSQTVEEAKMRVAAAKEAAAAKSPGSPAAPKPPVKKKEEGPKPVDASGHPLARKLKEKLDDALIEATEFLGQLSIRVEASRIVDACAFLRQYSASPFNYLTDITCVHLPDRTAAPFDVVYNLYSISQNERVRLKVATSDSEGVESVTALWPAANWMEREVYDLFGVNFRNHPDLRRLLLPPDWEGHPLRKDYALEFVENEWTIRHLPEMTEVQQEQLTQRRAYGLEILSVPEEREMRELFRGGKEVMPKDK